jgi:hypothetical protein
VLFLLDENCTVQIHTTGRSVPKGVVRGLVERGAIGLVTTHDLADSGVEQLESRAAELHFEVPEDGKMTLTISCGPGFVKSNALGDGVWGWRLAIT